MPNQKVALSTTPEREHNPKAVFFGEIEGIITPLAVYLSERSVDLFAAKELDDAFFGNYFFYVGPYENVKELVANQGQKLPKTALIITACSDINELKRDLSISTNIKLIEADDLLEIDNVIASNIMDFFLGSNERILILKALQNKKLLGIEHDIKKNLTQLSESKTEAQNKTKNITKDEKSIEELMDPNHKSEPTQSEIKTTEKNTDIVLEMQETAVKSKNSINAKTSSTTKEAETTPEIKSLYNIAPKSTESTRAVKIKKRLPLFTAAALFLIVLIGFPILLISLELGIAALGLKQGISALKNSNVQASEKYFKAANLAFSASRSNLNLTRPIFQLIRQSDLHRQLVSLNTVGVETSEGLGYITKAGESSGELFRAITGQDKGVAVGSLLSSIKGDVTLADSQLALVEAELKTQNMHDLFSRPILRNFQPLMLKTNQTVTDGRAALRTTLGGLSLLPETLGLFGKRVYLLVFQNNMELRPTGGFIGSYGLLTMIDGQLTDFNIEDVYTADGALVGHVDPPEPIRVYLGQEHWYMRDSNWDPDFAQSAARIAWFLEKEVDVKVDGVIAVDLDFAKGLLAQVGDINLTDFNENVNAGNLFELAHKHAQTDFFPGSTQKKDFLGSLTRALKEKLFSSQKLQAGFIEQVNQSLRSKDLMLFYVNPTLQALVRDYQLGGGIEPKQNCLSCTEDYAMIVDANLGVNKVNYYINQSESHKIDIDALGNVSHALTITYENTAPVDDKNFGDNYTDYMRLLLPVQAQLQSADIDGLRLDLRDNSLASPSSVTQTTVGKHKEIATLLKIPPQKKISLQFKYTTQFDIPNLERYVFTTIKQPGVKARPLELNLKYPSNWQIDQFNDADLSVTSTATLVKDAGITYNTTLSEDKTLDIKFLR